MNIFLTDYRRK